MENTTLKCGKTLQMIKRIFGAQHYEFGLDYIQLLVQNPTQKLPVLCLVGDKQTGKTAILKWIKALLFDRMSYIRQEEINSPFHGPFLNYSVWGLDDVQIRKKTLGHIKMLNSSSTVVINQRGKPMQEVEANFKFILASNDSKNFVEKYNSSTFWVCELSPICNIVFEYSNDLINEIPQFIEYLKNRELSIEPQSSYFFSNGLISQTNG